MLLVLVVRRSSYRKDERDHPASSTSKSCHVRRASSESPSAAIVIVSVDRMGSIFLSYRQRTLKVKLVACTTTLLPSSVPIRYLWMLPPYNLGGIFGSPLTRA